MEQCGSGGTKTYACMTTGPFPAESANFKWTKGSQALTNFVQYPAVLKADNNYIRVSTISTALTSEEDMTCTVTHKNGNISKNVRVEPKSPTLSLSQITTAKGQYVMCAIEDFYPKLITVTWKKNDMPVSSTEEISTKHSTGYYYAKSFLTLSSPSKKDIYTCEVTHSGQPITVKKSFEDKLSVVLTPPSGKYIFLQNTAVLDCIITGTDSKAVTDAQVTWKVDGKVPSKSPQDSPTKLIGNSQSQKVSKLEVEVAVWFSGKKVECFVHDNSEGKDIVNMKQIKLGEIRVPEVVIYKASDPNHDSVVCEVRGSSLGDVYIMWKVDGGDYQEGNTGIVKQQDGNMSHVSILTVKKDSTSRKFTCAVKHGGMKQYSSATVKEYSESEPGVVDEDVLHCTKSEDEEEDEYSSMWSTTTSFIFLFLFSLVYSAILSLVKIKH
ncbi:immunoglobulin heavy constant gamma 2A [Alosa pseudoharengus]|uniref:immunoglobulin heavy constant gamma 2A n=1 Tax=Alosa pseudoharengus TaxID=34774 RepID=UPI003F888F7E